MSLNPGDTGQLLGSFDRPIYIYIIQIYSGITCGRVLNGELYTCKLYKLIKHRLINLYNLHDNECPYWDQVSSHKTKFNLVLYLFPFPLYYYLLGKGGYVFGSIGLSVCEQHYSKSYERIGMKFYGRVLSSTSKNWLNFGGDLGIVSWVNEQKNTVIVVAYPDRIEGNYPEPFFFIYFFFRRVGSLSQPRLNIFTVDNMGVMMCLGQGGLRSLSASSSAMFWNHMW